MAISARAFYCARAVLPQMRAQGGGHLIHTASMAGRNIGPLSGPGLRRFQACGSGDEPFDQHGRVHQRHPLDGWFCPGEVNTPILKNRPNPLTPEELARMLQPEHCGDLIRYVACLPASVTINEVWITPTWNRGYVANLQRKPL